MSCTATVTAAAGEAVTGVDVLFDTASDPATPACTAAIGDLDADATGTCTVVYTLDAGADLAGTSVDLYAKVNASVAGTAVFGPTNVNLAKATLDVTAPTATAALHPASVNVTVTNTGPIDLASLNITLPTGFAWDINGCPTVTTLPAGNTSAPCTATHEVADVADLEGASVKNFAPFAFTTTTPLFEAPASVRDRKSVV